MTGDQERTAKALPAVANQLESSSARDATDAITATRRALERWDRAERERLLAGHSEERGRRRRALAADCEAATGHAFYDLPDNGINHFHFVTGKWPQECRWCGVAAPGSGATP